MPLKYQVKVAPAIFPHHSSTCPPSMINSLNTGQRFYYVNYILFRKGFSNGRNNTLVQKRDNSYTVVL